MITILPILAVLLTGTVPDDRYHVFAIDAPTTAATYRLRSSIELANVYTIEQLPYVAIFNSLGDPLRCEIVQWNGTVRTIKQTRPLAGQWIDVKASNPVPSKDATHPWVWSFDTAVLSGAEAASSLDIEWHTSSASGPGYVAVMTEGQNRYGVGITPSVALAENLADPHSGRSRLNVWGSQLAGELHFSRAPDELTIDRVSVVVLIPRNWARETLERPGWIMFEADGHAPYRLQAARLGTVCSGLPFPERGFPPRTGLACGSDARRGNAQCSAIGRGAQRIQKRARETDDIQVDPLGNRGRAGISARAGTDCHAFCSVAWAIEINGQRGTNHQQDRAEHGDDPDRQRCIQMIEIVGFPEP